MHQKRLKHDQIANCTINKNPDAEMSVTNVPQKDIISILKSTLSIAAILIMDLMAQLKQM